MSFELNVSDPLGQVVSHLAQFNLLNVMLQPELFQYGDEWTESVFKCTVFINRLSLLNGILFILCPRMLTVHSAFNSKISQR